MDSSTRRDDRLIALDGLRGLAALIVLACHALLVTPALSIAYGIGAGSIDPTQWWLTFTPVHLFWAGTEAVYVFFVLSGYVLTRAMTGASTTAWPGYYVRRLVRLYLPVWAAVALAALLYAFLPAPAVGASGWLALHDVHIDAPTIGRDMSLLIDPGDLITPLWSLKWEVVFSLLLPLVLVLAAWTRRLPAIVAIVLMLGVIGTGQAVGSFALLFLPMFGIGVLLARDRGRWSARYGRLRAPMRIGLGVVATLTLLAPWILGAATASPDHGAVALMLSAAGAALVVLLFAHDPAAIAVGSSRPLQWVGRRSFSLYLTHEPVVVTVAILTGWTTGWPVLLVSVGPALVIAGVFHRCCEAPAHRLAGWSGAAIDRAIHSRRSRKRTSDAIA